MCMCHAHAGVGVFGQSCMHAPKAFSSTTACIQTSAPGCALVQGGVHRSGHTFGADAQGAPQPGGDSACGERRVRLWLLRAAAAAGAPDMHGASGDARKVRGMQAYAYACMVLSSVPGRHGRHAWMDGCSAGLMHARAALPVVRPDGVMPMHACMQVRCQPAPVPRQARRVPPASAGRHAVGRRGL